MGTENTGIETRATDFIFDVNESLVQTAFYDGFGVSNKSLAALLERL